MSDNQGPPEWENQRLRILIPTTTLFGFATLFLGWRCVYGFTHGRKFLICDYLLVLSWSLSVVNVALRFMLVDIALGRHFMDPSIGGLPNILRYSHLLWVNQIVNIIAVAILKWSICAYLLVADFSKLYRAIVWFSILLILAFNFLAPVLTLFGCVPLEANWNRGVKGKCWAKGTLPLSYAQGIINILTDVMYVVAPLIYLSQVQLPKRTQWSLRFVFILSIAATVCSIFKTIELKTITKTKDPTWDGVNLAIWSGSELYVGILIASLPPLRKAFDDFFKRYFPKLGQTTRSNTGGYENYGKETSASHNIHLQTFGSKNPRANRPQGESVLDSDDESAKAILDDGPFKGDGIRKTTQVTIDEERSIDRPSATPVEQELWMDHTGRIRQGPPR
ncbi:hypothetical protein DM02DRAFT_667906 [Periconia macrospinosa]|uniref:Rhodopsin domain-containing protein n=1 Tax=Periconia macrospinosa TaxID=97972 RepID=A0A2V1E5P9_9PLEO|nr:hypothetical protein DM02DRAFT_667906 [Periconia macrospinosa]